MAVNIPPYLSDHPSLVGIIRFPKCNYETQEIQIPIISKDDKGYFNWINVVDVAKNIYGAIKTSSPYTITKNDITDFYPYTFYTLTDGESEPLILHPQYMPNTCYVKGEFALSNQPVERYYVENYKGDVGGRIYNITNLNQMMLPTATNEGINYMNANANTVMQNRKSQVTGNVLNGVIGVASAITKFSPMGAMSAASNVISGINSIKETDARNKDMMLTPNSISSFGTPSTRQAFGTDSVRIVKYTIQDKYKEKIRNYVNRYGNKFMNYGLINLKTYRGYIKFIDPDVNGGILEEHKLEIKRILERGVKVE